MIFLADFLDLNQKERYAVQNLNDRWRDILPAQDSIVDVFAVVDVQSNLVYLVRPNPRIGDDLQTLPKGEHEAIELKAQHTIVHILSRSSGT